MKILHIFKTEPDEHTNRLVYMLRTMNDHDSTVINLDDSTDYDMLIDIIFEHDKVISWW